MGRAYAGILGSLAMAVVICRGVIGSGGVANTLTTAIAYLAVFSLVGAIIGQIAEVTVDESIRATLEQELAVSADDLAAQT